MVKDAYQPYKQPKRVVRKYYLSFYYNYSKFPYKYYLLEILIDFKSLINKDLLRKNTKEEVLNGRYSFCLITK